MAGGESTVRGGTSDVGEGGVGARMIGDSLPPRKRLLAGLKQNGLWLAASNPTSSISLEDVHRSEGGTHGAGTAGTKTCISAAFTVDTKVNCMSCGVVESSGWRRVKRNGAVLRLCNLCAQLFNKNLNCPHCLVVYPDAKDPTIWLQCCRCQRSVHVECEQRCGSHLPASPYVCPGCVQLKEREEHSSVLLGTGARGNLGMNCDVEAGHCASPAAAECSIPCNKKSRLTREPNRNSSDVEAEDAGNFEGMFNNTKILLGRKGSASQEAAAAAAAAVAALAGRAAAAAKASAAAKAATAVKAAAVAKAALDAAAFAARVEAQARVELRRSAVPSERAAVGGVLRFDAAPSHPQKEQSEEPEVNAEGEGIPVVTTPSSIDDEELARQLHRAINSSPRISGGLTPLRRKLAVTPGAISNAPHTVASWQRLGLLSESELRPQSKHQQTRPRSISHKETKRIDLRGVQPESKTSGGNNYSKITERSTCTVASGNISRPVSLKSEPVDSNTVSLVMQVSGATLRQDETSAPLDLMLKTETDPVNGVSEVFCDNRNRRLSSADISQAAAMLDEVLLSEVDADDADKEEYLSRFRGSMSPDLKEDPSATTMLIIEEADGRPHARLFEDAGRESAGCERITNMLGVTALVQVASSAIELLKKQDTSASEPYVEDKWAIDSDGDSLQDVRARESSGQLSRSAVCPISGGHSKATADVESSLAYGRLSQPTDQGGGQEFARSVHLTSFPSAPRVQAPPLSCASAGRQS